MRRGSFVWIVLVIVGLAAGIIGLRQGSRIRTATETTATVVGEVFEESTDSDGRATTYRYPVYEYTYRGETVQNRATASGGTAIGERVTIYLDENGNMYEKGTAKALTRIGFLAAAVSLAALSVSRRRRFA